MLAQMSSIFMLEAKTSPPCKVDALPHMTPATAVVVFHQGSVLPYEVSADKTVPGPFTVIGQWVIGVASIIGWFRELLSTTAVGCVVF